MKTTKKSPILFALVMILNSASAFAYSSFRIHGETSEGGFKADLVKAVPSALEVLKGQAADAVFESVRKEMENQNGLHFDSDEAAARFVIQMVEEAQK